MDVEVFGIYRGFSQFTGITKSPRTTNRDIKKIVVNDNYRLIKLFIYYTVTSVHNLTTNMGGRWLTFVK